MSLEITKSKGENIKVYAWNSSRKKMLPFKTCMVSTDNTELLQIWQKIVQL